MNTNIEHANIAPNPDALSDAVSDAVSDGTIEGTVFNERQVRILKFVVIGLGILLLLGFALVIITIVYQASQMGGGKDLSATPTMQGALQTGASANGASIAIPKGSKIISTSLNGRRLAVTLEKNGAYSILIINTKSGRLESRTELTPPVRERN